MMAQGYGARCNPRLMGHRPKGSHAPLTEADIARNRTFLSRVASIVPQPDRNTASPQPAGETRVPDLAVNVEYVLSKIIMKPVTPQNLREWCREHREDGEALVLGQSRNLTGVGPVTVEKSLDILAVYGLERSKPLNLGAPVMAALERLIGEYPNEPAIRKWAAGHRKDWKALLYAMAVFGNRAMGEKKLAAVSAVLEAHGCEKGQLEPAGDFGLSPQARNMLMRITSVQRWPPSALRAWSEKGARNALEEVLSLLRRLEAGGQGPKPPGTV
ncbi:MAG: hypothetical protein PHV13_03710 [Candidatus ainarchaeum sp.]|nr:hypothetical protein [Candidatus ainarchaeum sp.]